MNIKQRLKTLGLTFLLGASSLNSKAQNTEPVPADPMPQTSVEQISSPTMDESISVMLDDGEMARHADSFFMMEEAIKKEKHSHYAYIPKSQEDFSEMAEKAINIINKVDPDNKFGQKLISFYNENKDNEVNLDDPLIRKSFLAFKKIVKRGRITSTSNNAGKYNETSYLLGIDAKAFHQLNQEANSYMKAFCNQIYSDDSRFKMLDVKDAPQAEKIAEQLLADKLNAYHISPQDTSFQYSNFKSAVFTNDADNEWNDWGLQLYIVPNELKETKGRYCPLAVVKAHELGHIMQRLPGEKENYGAELVELAPTIELIVMQDIIYKKMNGIPLEQEVKYQMSSETGINNGKIANTFREIKEKYNLRSYEDVLLTQEAKKSINMFMTQNSNMAMLANTNQNNL